MLLAQVTGKEYVVLEAGELGEKEREREGKMEAASVKSHKRFTRFISQAGTSIEIHSLRA